MSLGFDSCCFKLFRFVSFRFDSFGFVSLRCVSSHAESLECSSCLDRLLLASLQCLPFGITAMPPPVRQSRCKITVCSIGWSDVPDHAEHLLGFVFDLEQVGRDADGKGRRWNFLAAAVETWTVNSKRCGPLQRFRNSLWIYLLGTLTF